MLTAQLVRVRFARDKVIPRYVDAADAELLAVAGDLISEFRAGLGRSRGELAAEFDDLGGDPDSQFVHRGLIKLLEDRCEFGVNAVRPPEDVRETVFRLAAHQRIESAFDRSAAIAAAAGKFGITADEIESALLADLKTEQQLICFNDITPERLLKRYNLALAQGILLKAVRVTVEIRHESPVRLRSILHRIKFHRLVCTAAESHRECCRFVLDGPLSLFSATHKYGVQLASFLTAIVPCRDFELQAELLWGAQRKPKTLTITSEDGLTVERADSADRPLPELSMFAEQFRRKIVDWRLIEETNFVLVHDWFWTPDFRLEHVASGHVVYLEVMGYWRRAGIERHLERLRKNAPARFVLAVSDRLRVDDEEMQDIAAEVVRFRQMPLPEIVAERAASLLATQPTD